MPFISIQSAMNRASRHKKFTAECGLEMQMLIFSHEFNPPANISISSRPQWDGNPKFGQRKWSPNIVRVAYLVKDEMISTFFLFLLPRMDHASNGRAIQRRRATELFWPDSSSFSGLDFPIIQIFWWPHLPKIGPLRQCLYSVIIFILKETNFNINIKKAPFSYKTLSCCRARIICYFFSVIINSTCTYHLSFDGLQVWIVDEKITDKILAHNIYIPNTLWSWWIQYYGKHKHLWFILYRYWIRIT